ncbi:TPA: YnfA family protein [Escherichia coli]|nr:YnfA family protein [Escherichia coli]EEY8718891.1 YnfA family protein [Escherichia coli]EEY9248366.1 YnfA family protein [Escherichia coli]EEY9409649.1 YnfA family protein [Escherichia coli]EFC0719551.1 YnfA family protein [Escherichia coli]EFH7822242.1 YnfA family protein [Escherichia coli]
MIKTTLLFFATALCEIIGCFLPWLWLKRNASIWLLLPAGISLALFVWLLTLHPAASGRVYAAYGGVYVCTALMWLRVVDGVKLTLYDWTGALMWLRVVDGVKLTLYDWTGALIALCGMLIIVAGWGRT